MTCAVYLIKNLITKKRYVGATGDVSGRISMHFSLLRKNRHCNVGMQEDFNKHGELSFIYGILKKTGDLPKTESYFINKLKPEYNIRNVL